MRNEVIKRFKIIFFVKVLFIFLIGSSNKVFLIHLIIEIKTNLHRCYKDILMESLESYLIILSNYKGAEWG